MRFLQEELIEMCGGVSSFPHTVQRHLVPNVLVCWKRVELEVVSLSTIQGHLHQGWGDGSVCGKEKDELLLY